MRKNRLEAISDGVIAIVMTIMVLELKVPHDASLHAVFELWPIFLGYVLSFIYIAIYWNNHHHLLYITERVTGGVLWANMHFLFWLTLLPFTTGWLSENDFKEAPTFLYGLNLFACATAYWILMKAILRVHDKNSEVAQALTAKFKDNLSIILYALALGVVFFAPIISIVLYAVVAGMWLLPDSRIENRYKRQAP